MIALVATIISIIIGAYIVVVSLTRLTLSLCATDTVTVRTIYACAFGAGLIAVISPPLTGHRTDFVELALEVVVALQMWGFRANWANGTKPRGAMSVPGDFDSQPHSTWGKT